MDLKLYQKEANALEGKAQLTEDPAQLVSQMLVGFISTGKVNDVVKRHVYYGTDMDFDKIEAATHSSTLANDALAIMDKDACNNVNMSILHGLVGLSTEVGEIAEEMHAALAEGRELNMGNIVEETGDLMWYLALILRECGVSFEDAAKKNIEKLSKRYPDGFTTQDAVNRDIDAEQQVFTEKD